VRVRDYDRRTIGRLRSTVSQSMLILQGAERELTPAPLVIPLKVITLIISTPLLLIVWLLIPFLPIAVRIPGDPTPRFPRLRPRWAVKLLTSTQQQQEGRN
jgi:hypothetical protein